MTINIGDLFFPSINSSHAFANLISYVLVLEKSSDYPDSWVCLTAFNDGEKQMLVWTQLGLSTLIGDEN